MQRMVYLSTAMLYQRLDLMALFQRIQRGGTMKYECYPDSKGFVIWDTEKDEAVDPGEVVDLLEEADELRRQVEMLRNVIKTAPMSAKGLPMWRKAALSVLRAL
jgi:hypothetical protein